MARNIDTCRCSWVDCRICSCRHDSRLVDNRLIDNRLVDSRVVGGILLGSQLDGRSLIWSRFWKWGDERQRLSYRACQKFVHTNFVSLQLTEDLYNKLQNFDFFKDMASISGCSSQRTSSDSSLRELWCKVCNLILHERSSTASKVRPFQFFKLESSWLLECLPNFKASSSLGDSPQWAIFFT